MGEFRPGDQIDSKIAWEFARKALDTLDSEMGQILSKRSAAYWLHIYRRIGVFLSPEHEDKTDPVTIGLVRQIVELAIQKHGRLESWNEFGNSTQLSPNLILGGWMKKGLKALGGKGGGGVQLFRQYSEMLRREPNLVVRDFGKKDFIGIHEVEGAAYQYWRLTALLRSIGKGASIKIDEDGDWNYVPDMDLRKLLISFDARNESTNSFSSLLGVWLDEEDSLDKSAKKEITGSHEGDTSYRDTVFVPVYNVNRIDLECFDFLGVLFPRGSVTNFFPLTFHVGRFLHVHGFMEAEFEKRYGYYFTLFLEFLAALSYLCLLPRTALLADDEDLAHDIKLRAFLQTLTRGYHVFQGSSDDMCQMVAERIEIQFKKKYQIEQLRKVVASLSLNRDQQGKISLWSGGPRAVVIPGHRSQIVDFVSIPSILQTLFVYMSDEPGESGTAFEQLFRKALERREIHFDSGVIVSADGKEREMDAGVQIDGCLYIFECVSIQRPLDFEIGKPRTIEMRTERLMHKLKQAKSLRDFISENPVGRNYNYSSTNRVEYFVVSPFVEWVWSYEPELWSGLGHPRVMSAGEAISLLEAASSL